MSQTIKLEWHRKMKAGGIGSSLLIKIILMVLYKSKIALQECDDEEEASLCVQFN